MAIIVPRKRERTRAVRQSQVTLMRKRVRARYGENAYGWTVERWERILEAFRYRCVYCGQSDGPETPLAADHLIPLALGGTTTINNMAPACKSCNSKKGAKLPWNFCSPDKYRAIADVLTKLQEELRTRPITGGGCNDHTLSFALTPKKREKKMALLTKSTGQSGTDFEPCPEGDFQAVVVDVCDLGWLEKTFEGKSQGLKPHVQLVYAIMDDDVRRDDGAPYLVFGRRLVLSTHERAGFYKEICGILGKKSVDAALEDGTLDTEDLVGVNVRAVVIHNRSADGTKVYANLESVTPWNAKFSPAVDLPDTYVRRCDRDDWNEKKPVHSAFGPAPHDPDDAELEKLSQAGRARAQGATEPLARDDARLSNDPNGGKSAAKRILADEAAPRLARPVNASEDDDEPNIFDDDLTPEQRALAEANLKADHQGTLVDAPKTAGRKANTAHA